MNTRVQAAQESTCNTYTQRVLQAQRETWGAPLNNHLIYARRPALFKAVRGMWAGLNKDGHLPETLIALVNRHVAAINNCFF